MPTVKVTVKNKIAQGTDDVIVCNNNDYIIEFAFDEEWQSHAIKTARFYYDGKSVDVVFEGNTVSVPPIQNASVVEVGVYAGDLHTTTPALLSCAKSILCNDGTPVDPLPDVYGQLMELFKAGRVNDAYIDENGHLIITLENGETYDAGYCGTGGGGSIDVDKTYDPDSENAQSGKAVAEAIEEVTKTIGEAIDEVIAGMPQPIKYVESLPDDELVNFRDLETGTYVLNGYFSPYANSDISVAANNAFTLIYTIAAGTHVLCVNAKNSVVNFMEILPDETTEKGYTFTRTNISLMDLYGLLERVTALETITGDFETVLDELHEYAEAIKGGE